jgi:hypothetical protein
LNKENIKNLLQLKEDITNYTPINREFNLATQARGKTNAKAHHVLFSIPEDDLDSNSALEQNSGN